MLTLRNIPNPFEFSRYLKHGDDPAFRAGLPWGRWLGTGAIALGRDSGLNCWVTKEGCRNMLAACTTQAPASRLPGGRVLEGGSGYELLFTAPADVSTLYAAGSSGAREVLAEIQCRAVEHTLECLEQAAASLTPGRGASPQDPAGLVAASFPHETSDTIHPDLHAHLLIFHRPEGAGGPGMPPIGRFLSQYLPALQAVYLCQLDGLLVHALGLATEIQKDSLRITGVPQELAQVFCPQSAGDHSFMEELMRHAARALDWVAQALHPNRGTDPIPVRYVCWRTAGMKHGFSQDRAAALMHIPTPDSVPGGPAKTVWSHQVENLVYRGRYLPQDTTRQQAVEGAVLQAVVHATEERNPFGEHHLIRSMAKECQLRHLGPLPIWGIVHQLLGQEPSPGRHAPEPPQLASSLRKQVGIEQERLEPGVLSLHANPILESLLAADTLTRAGIHLSAAEQAALTHLIEAPGSIKVLDGFSHDRMTMILVVANTLWTRDPGVGTVVGTSAIRGLEQDQQAHTGIRGIPLDRLLWPQPGHEPIPGGKTILVVEEAQRCSPRILARLIEQAEAAGATLVLAAPHGQDLEPSATPQATGARTAERDADAGRAGAPRGVSDEDRLRHIAESREESLRTLIRQWQQEGLQDPRAHVIFAATHEDALELNRLAQAQRRDAGALGRECVTVNETPIYTNDRVLFTGASLALGISPGTTGSVRAALPQVNCLLVVTDEGRLKPLPIREFQELELGYAVPMEHEAGRHAANAYVFLGEPPQAREVGAAQFPRANHDTHLFYVSPRGGPDLEGLLQPLETTCQPDLAAFSFSPESDLDLENDYDLSPER